jgi:hypothetical protein
VSPGKRRRTVATGIVEDRPDSPAVTVGTSNCHQRGEGLSFIRALRESRFRYATWPLD